MKRLMWVLITIILFISVGTGAFFYYIKSTDKDISDDPEVQKIIESDYTFDLPEDLDSPVKPEDPLDAADDSEGNEESQPVENSKPSNVQSNEQYSSDMTQNSASANRYVPEVTVNSIKDKYLPTLESLESQANTKVNALIENAISEYQSKKQAGESISYGYFYNKYNAAAQDLETKTDTAFASIYSAVQQDLEKHGFSPEHAEEIQEHYETTKKERKSYLVKKAMEKFF